MVEENRLPPVLSLSAYCLIIVIKVKKAHAPQIWQKYCQEDITPILLPSQAYQ